ncbi:homeobox protein engrailed-1-B-like [Anticarsia gemmatalis]|uniref:homeobox protein engrailed-1-B-like n=1 Tax=Anticarsia gemmatalis TaxID=129554 RepID=UPI003F76FCCD
MDTSPVQSTSKCGSDFSIERILRSDNTRHTGGRSDNVQVPDWLCCTRYRPPRLPRAVSGSGCRARRSGRHARVPFTAAQASALEAAYARAPYLAPPALRALAAALQLRDDRIKIWFQNRRARERREKSANIAPPLAVTLPPTAGAQVPWMTTNCSWNSIRDDIPLRQLNYNPNIKCEDSRGFERVTENDRDVAYSERSSFSESTDEDRSDLPLDIETIDD